VHDLHPMLQLKVDHSTRVAAEARALSSELGWPASKRNAAETLGLVHDIGRFSQFADYGTFSDAASVDHGERGWTVIQQTGWFRRFPVLERAAILDGVRYHNRRVIPEGLSAMSFRFVRLIRDADKLDIFRVVLDALDRDGFRELPEMFPNITLDRSPSPAILDEVFRERNGALQNVKSLGDFLVMQLSWMYDLNYGPTFRRVQNRDILPRLLSQLTASSAVRALGEQARQFVSDRLDESAPSDPDKEWLM